MWKWAFSDRAENLDGHRLRHARVCYLRIRAVDIYPLGSELRRRDLMAILLRVVIYALLLESFATPAFAQKVTVDAQRHIHYGTGSAVFPIVLYDFNSNLCNDPVNELQLVTKLAIDTVINVVCEGSDVARNIATAMQPYGLHLWSTVSGGIAYNGNDPGSVNELVSVPNVTGYFLTDEPDVSGTTPSDMTATNVLNARVKAVDPTALRVTSFNDGTFGGTFPNYGGGMFDQYQGSEVTMDVLGNSFWNNSPPRSTNGLYDVTLETSVWDGVANQVFPTVPLFTDIGFYGPAAGASCYLTRQQFLSEAWTAVINNTSGLAIWAVGQGETSGGPLCDRTHTNATYEQLWEWLIQETETIKAIAPAILSPVDDWYMHVQPETAIQTTGRRGWIFAANLTQDAVQDSFSGISLGSSVVAYAGNPDGSNRTICRSCGSSFADSLPGFVAYAYQITYGGTPSPTPTSTPTPSQTLTPTPAPTPIPIGSTVRVTVRPRVVKFGSQLVGTTSGNRIIVVKSRWGNKAPLVMGNLAIRGSSDFAIVPSATTCMVGLALVPGRQCQIAATFSPSAPGVRTASIIITDNASHSPQSVSLFGRGY
jgi:hypothetical protein